MKLPIYLDHHATTPCDPAVVEAMLPYFGERFGNPSSRSHAFGWEAEDAAERAREDVARLIGCRSKEIVFTSGATESNNLAIHGTLAAYRSKGRHMISCVTEHKAVLDPAAAFEKAGGEVTYLGVDRLGRIVLDELKQAIRPGTVLVTLMTANNEVGTIHPLAEIGSITREAGVLFHTDAAQAAGMLPIDVEAMKIDLLSLSAHKMYGPKGVGALYVRRRNPRVRLVPISQGGGHERGRRSGTLNVPGIVGLGRAASLAAKNMAAGGEKIAALRNRLEEQIRGGIESVVRNGDPDHSLPNNLNMSFPWVDGESLLMAMEDVAVSPASACSSGAHEASYVLLALGIDDDLARSSIRFGLGRYTTEEEIDYAAAKVIAAVERLRAFSPMFEREAGRETA